MEAVRDNANILAFWNDYKSRNAVTHDTFSIAAFGDSPELADHLADLIKRGIKTATSSAYLDYINADEIPPTPGSIFIVIDSKAAPVCVCEVTDVRIAPLESVDATFAFAEGEGDRTLESWLREHRRFFGLTLLEGVQANETCMVVFERFRLLWPSGGILA
jgi:uncharacterized protein YhfF